MPKKMCSKVTHISPLNKFLVDTEVKPIFEKVYPELDGRFKSHNQLLTYVLKVFFHYCEKDYEQLKLKFKP